MFYARNGLWDGGGPLSEKQYLHEKYYRISETKFTREIELTKVMKFI